MNHDDDITRISLVEPGRDRQLGALLARADSEHAESRLAVARQRYRIGVAARQQWRDRLATRTPTWVEWTARVARPLPIGIAAALLIASTGVMMWTPAPRTDAAAVASASVTDGASVASLAATGATTDQIMDALIAPVTTDSLLARAFATPLAAGR